MIFQLGWRNIWRVPRRTFIIVLAVTIGIWSMNFFTGLMHGMMDQMLDGAIKQLTGHLQVQKKGYFQDPVIDYSFEMTEEIEKYLNGEELIWTKRIQVPGVISNSRNSAGITVVGILPEKEAQVSFVKNSIIEGSYLNDQDKHGVIIGKKLAEKFETQLGSKLVLMSQDTSGEIASKGFRIKGIFDTQMEATEEQYIFILLSTAGEMLKINNDISQICMMLSDVNHLDELQSHLSGMLGDDFNVMNWQQMLPLMLAQVKIFNWFSYLWYIVMFVAMAFGIINTLLMAVMERMKEFGMLKAIGMMPSWLVSQVMVEAFCMILMGIIIGDLASFLSITYVADIGIDLTRFAAGAEEWGISQIIIPKFLPFDMCISNIFVLLIGLGVSLYPAVKAGNITPVQALTKRG